MILRLEHVVHVRGVGLIATHDERVGGVGLVVDGEVCRCPVDRDPILLQRVHELHGGGEVGLVRGDDVAARVSQVGIAEALEPVGWQTAAAEASSAPARCCTPFGGELGGHALDEFGPDGPRVLAPALDSLRPHAIAVVEQGLAVPRGVVQNGAVVRDRVVDGLPEMPLLRLDRSGQIVHGQQPVGHELDTHGRWVTLRLRQDADHVVEVTGGAEVAVEPRGIVGPLPHCRTRLTLGDESLMHGRAHGLDSERHERMYVVVWGIPERRCEEYRARGARLVVVVHDLGIPLAEHDTRDVLGLGLCHHVGVAVVVVPDVLLIESGDAAGAALHRVGLAHVPARHQLHSVRIGVHQQRDHVVQKALSLGVVEAHHLIGHLHELRCAKDFGRV